MAFLNAYFTVIDIIAIAAVVILVGVAFFRKENAWLGLLALIVIIWATSSVFGVF